ncbi:MAG: peptidase M61, partial [Phormidesmis sp. CAN_BIN36]|nr:peptidase M61 [Phormidesmis sp. CAN_BIN36]
AGDELLAIDGWRISADQINDRLKDYQPGDAIEIAVFHQDELRVRSITLMVPQPTQYQVLAIEQPSTAQQRNFQGWLGVPLTTM